jgi:hypothetical protein
MTDKKREDSAMKIRGLLCPICGNKLTCDPAYSWPERWIGLISWSSCEPCERFFYILSDEDAYPITVIDAEFGMYEGDDGYSFDPNVNGQADDPDYDYHMAMQAKRPKCDICGVRTPIPVAGSKRCKKCLDRFGDVVLLTAEAVR